jgi:protein involved in polysaccharide export with SLBB domain
MHPAISVALGLTTALAWSWPLTAAEKRAPAPAAPAQAEAAGREPVAASRLPDRLDKGDKVEFSIEEDPVKSGGPQELIVLPLGDINFPVSRNSDLLIPIRAAGKTIDEVKASLKAKLDADYYQNATVFLRPKEQAPRRAQVLFTGQVRTSILNLNGGETVTLFEALLRVGTTEFAHLKKVTVHRKSGAAGKPETLVLDVAAMQKGDRSKDISLQDGDLVEVPEKTLRLF